MKTFHEWLLRRVEMDDGFEESTCEARERLLRRVEMDGFEESTCEADVAELRRKIAERLEARDARKATIERKYRAEGERIEAELLGDIAAKLDPLVARMCDEPTHADTRAAASFHAAAAESFAKLVGRDLGVRLFTLALIRHVRPADALAFAGEDAWSDSTYGLVTRESALGRALKNGAPREILDALGALEAAIRKARAATPKPEAVPELKARWAAMATTFSVERINAAGAPFRAAARALAFDKLAARPVEGENPNGTRFGSRLVTAR